MTTPPRHRKSDLLCALLAQQMSLISRDQLLEAANLWLEDPGRQMSALLQELGHLGPDDVSMLVEAVEMHKSPTGSGTAMERATTVDPDVREALLALRPPVEIRQWLVRLNDRRQTVPVPPPVPAVSRAARYDLGEEIARGGLGRVVEAHDRDLDRDVAVKLVLDDLAPEAAARFAREAKLTARLDHPSIVPIHDFGTLPGPDGRPRLFLCMKRIRGRDLGATLQGLANGNAELRTKWTRARMLGVFQDICLGMAYAHSKGVIHRDLKPSNVMIGDFGETLIVDWGLAKEMNAPPEEGKTRRMERPASGAKPQSARITLDGDVVGTPAYMPPEQAEGRVELIDERSDVFALGAILYAMLTLRPPWEGDSATEVLESVRSGRISAPSSRSAAPSVPSTVVTLRLPSSRGQVDPIPPELDAICMRALALRREDRFASALDLHHEIQLFLEGVKERDRKLREATERLEEGRRFQARHADLAREIATQETLVEKLLNEIEDWRPAEEKRPLWDAEAWLRALQDERVDVEARALAAYGQALVADPACRGAEEGTCGILYERCIEAERARDRTHLLRARKALAPHDHRGAWAARLDAPGKLTLRAFRRSCACLRPRCERGWRASFGIEMVVPWVEGRARPDIELTETHRAVPVLRVDPPGARFGHALSCPHEDARGIPVFASRFEIREKRLQPGAERRLGVTPLVDVELSQGSWRCVLRPEGGPEVIVPVQVRRGAHWVQDVALYPAGDVPDGFVLVTGGPFTFGGSEAGAQIEEIAVTRDVFISRFPVTCAEYLEFLNSLPLEEARGRMPRENEKRFWVEENGRIRLPRAGEDERLAWEPNWPVFAVTWLDAIAYCAWISAREGRVYRLPHEQEIEKAIRGVDGRTFSFGDEYDGAFSHTNVSIRGKISPLPVGSFPIDQSVYGLRDGSGGIANLCLNSAPVPYRDWRIMRGGAWSTTSSMGRASLRIGNPPNRTSWSTGFRLVVGAEEWPPSKW